MSYSVSKRRYGWNRPRTPGWLGLTVTTRLGIVLVLVLAATGRL